MENILKQAYRDGRKAASLDPQQQQERRANVLERTEALANEMIEKLKIQGSLIIEEIKQLAGRFERLLMGRTPEAHEQNLRMGRVYLALFIVILAAESWLLKWTFRPFDLGVESFVISLGLMLCGTAAIEEYLRALSSRNPATFNKWRLWLVFFSAIFFIVSLLLLSNARAALISANAHGESLEAQVSTANRFYAHTSFVYIAIALGSLAIVFVAGLLLHEAISRTLVSGPVVSHAKRIKEREQAIGRIASSIKEYEALPKKAVSEYDRGALDGPRSEENFLLSPVAMILIALGLILVIAVFARGEEISNQSVVLLFDLSGSIQGADYLEKTEFQKNLQFVEEIIKKLELGTHLRIFGITEQSFEKPFIILDQEISKARGYFSEKNAREKLLVINAWKKLKLEAKAKGTDVFGALIYASLLFDKEQGQRKLIILSDLRNTTEIDFETPQIISEKAFRAVEEKGLIAELRGVEVWAIGVSTINKPFLYWNSLKEFWIKYFEKAGAHLVSYSAERRWDSKTKAY
jgi:hypothetical protein